MTPKERNNLLSRTSGELAKELISRRFGLAVGDISFEKGKNGKPFVAGHPEVFFNISHCDTAAAIALSSRPVGVDIERFRSFSPYAEKRLFSEKELRYINSGERIRRGIELWTLREAVSKADGTGFSDWYYHAGLADENGLSSYCVYNGTTYSLMTYLFDDLAVSAAFLDGGITLHVNNDRLI